MLQKRRQHLRRDLLVLAEDVQGVGALIVLRFGRMFCEGREHFQREVLVRAEDA